MKKAITIMMMVVVVVLLYREVLPAAPASPYEEICRRIMSGERNIYMAQAHQDWYIYHNLFKNLGRKGVFVDVGANDALYCSNTLFFEKCLGWSGVAFEPQERYHEGWETHRPLTTLYPNCVSLRPKTGIRIVGEAGKGAVVEGGGSIRCVNLKDKVKGKEVDFMSVDVEGFEAEVMRSGVWPRVVLIETNKQPLEALLNYMHKAGYVSYETFFWSKDNKFGGKRNGYLDTLFVRLDFLTSKEKLYPPAHPVNAPDAKLMEPFNNDHVSPMLRSLPSAGEW